MLSLASVGSLRASRAEGAWRVQARKYTNNFPNGQFRALFFRPFVGHSGKRSMSAPRFVANMFPYRFPAPVVPGSVAARPAVLSGPAFSFPFRSPTSRSFLPRSSPPRSFALFGSHSGLRTISFRPSAGSFQRRLAVGPSSPINRLMAVLGLRPIRVAGGRRNCWGTIFVRPSSRLIAPRRALPGLDTSVGFKTSYLGLFRHLGRAGNP